MLALTLTSCGGKKDDGKQEGAYSQGLSFTVSASNPAECIITGIGSCTDKNIVIPSYINGMRVVGIADGAFSPKASNPTASADAPASPRLGKVALGLIRSCVAMNGLLMGGITYDTVTDGASQSGNVQFGAVNGGYIVGGNGLYETNDGDNGEPYETGDGEPIALEKIESVQIPATVTSIGKEAFYGCEDLASISTHQAISSIGTDAFKDTAYYNNPQNWDGQGLYLRNYLLTVSDDVSGEFVVRDGTTMIANSAFYQCYRLTAVYMPQEMSSVGDYAFYGCTSLANVYTDGVTKYSVGADAFEGSIYYKTYSYQFEVNPDGSIILGNGNLGVLVNPYSLIDEGIFEEAKNTLPTNYTCKVITTEEFRGTVEYYHTDGVDSYYRREEDGTLTKELFIHTEEGNKTAYGYFGDGLYRTTATFPTPIAIPEDLRFDDFKRNMTTGTYTYTTGNVEDGDRFTIELGFREKALQHMKIETPEATIEVSFSSIDSTVDVPVATLDNLIPGVIVDENGNPLNRN